MALIPTNELVAEAWISSITDFVIDSVGTQLPSDETTWATNGAVVLKVVGGSPNIYLGVRQPVVQVDCWTTVPNSDRLTWGHARSIAEAIRAATMDNLNMRRLLTISVNGQAYPNAWAQEAHFVTEPRDIYSDQGDYSGVTFDMSFSWTYAQQF